MIRYFYKKIPNRAEITLFDYTHDNKYKKQVKFRIFYFILFVFGIMISS